jgi:hypothetical protein
MILMRANTFRRPLEGVGPEYQDFFGSWNGNEQSPKVTVYCRLFQVLNMAHVLPLMVRLQFTVSCTVADTIRNRLTNLPSLPGICTCVFQVSSKVDSLGCLCFSRLLYRDPPRPASCHLNIYNMFKWWEKWWHCVGSACLQCQAASQFYSTGQITA